MPKFISPASDKLLRQKTGTEPFIVVQINWGLSITNYTSREAGSGYNANIMEIGPIRNERRADSMCNVGSVRVKFSDTDGALKFVIDQISAENAPAAVYLAFAGTTPADWIELIRGRTVGPVVWDERERTCELEIETLVRSLELGFTATKADFSDINPQAEGVPWPMIFGKCAHVPSLMIRRHALAHLQCTLKFWLPTVYALTHNNDDLIMLGNPFTFCFLQNIKQVGVLYVDDASQFPKGKNISIIINDIVFNGFFVDNTKFQILESNVPKYTNVPIGAGVRGDADFNNPSVLWLNDDTPIVNHHCYLSAPTGREWYNYCIRQEGRKCWFRFPFRNPQSPFQSVTVSGGTIAEVYGITKCGFKDDVAGDIVLMKDAVNARKKNPGQNNYGALIARLNKLAADGASWWAIPMDAEVRLWNAKDPDVYIASLTPLDEVKAVWGKRRVDFNGKTKTIFSQIPQDYYTVQSAYYTINKLKATGLIFNTPLTDYADQQWEEDIFVTAKGTIGPNPIDIIQWIIANFTDLTIDSLMFNGVRNKTTYEANFAIFDKRDALKICQEIAFQARCALLLDQGGIGVVYLPSEPGQSWNFDESSVKDVKLHFTERKDIVTKLVVSYSETYKDKHHLAKSYEINIREIEKILRSLLPTATRTRSDTEFFTYTNNISKYGLHTREESAYIYNSVEGVQAMADFWGFRFSNSWRLVELTTWIEGLRLQVFDKVVINFADASILNTTLVPGVIDSVEFNPNDLTTRLMIWLPIVAGGHFIESGFWPG